MTGLCDEEFEQFKSGMRQTPGGRLLVRYGLEPYNTESQARRVAERAAIDFDAIETAIFRVANECNCRAEHGAEGAVHLLAIEKMLRNIVKEKL